MSICRTCCVCLSVFSLTLFVKQVVAQPSIDDIHAVLETPDDLEVSVWARAPMFYNPTSIDVDERGRIWVAEAVNYRGFNNQQKGPHWHEKGDRIVILEDTDGDGTADSSKVFVQDEDLTAPLGVSVIGDHVVVTCSPNLIVYTRNQDDEVIGKTVLLGGWGGFDHDHALHEVEAGPDGRWYFNVGNAGPHVVTDASGWTLRSGSWYTGGSPHNPRNTPGVKSDDGRVYTGGLFMRVDPDGTDLEVLGHGFRNAMGVCVDSFGEFWMNDNDDTISCRTTWLMKYADTGYNSKDGRRGWQADRRPGQTIPTAHWRQEDPGVIPSGHIYGTGAPTGITHYENGALGENYNGGVLLSCESGQNIVFGYRRQIQGAGFALEPFAFLKSKDGPNSHWFRPADVAVGTDGTVFVADWFDPIVGGHLMEDRIGSGAIYRVTSKIPSDPMPEPSRSGVEWLDDAIARIASPAVNVRANGQRDCIRRGETPENMQYLGRILRDRSADRFLRARVAWVLCQLGNRGMAQVRELLFDRDPEFRALAWRCLELGGADLRPFANVLADDASPLVRREIALSMREMSDDVRLAILPRLAARYDGQDRWMLEAIGTGAEGIESDVFDVLYESMNPGPATEWSDAFADLAWRLHPTSAVPEFTERALDPRLSFEARKQATDALGFIPTREAGEAMLEIAVAGDPDLGALSRWWVQNRSRDQWRGFELVERLPSRYPGDPRYDTGVIRQGSYAFEIDVRGATQLHLVASDAGDGMSYDWCSWVELELVHADGSVTALTDLPWSGPETGWGTLNRHKSANGGPITLDGNIYDEGIGGHANMSISFDIEGMSVERFRGRVGVDGGGADQPNSRATIRAMIYHNGLTELDRALSSRSQLLDESLSMDERIVAGESMARSGEGGQILIALARNGALGDDLREALADAIADNPDVGVRIMASEFFPRSDGYRDPLPSISQLAAMDGDATRGDALFFGDRATCSTCHVFDGKGTELGPDLTAIATKFDRAGVIDAMLNPGAAVLQGYEITSFEMRDGRVVTGFVIGSGRVISVRDATGDVQAFEASDVAKTRNLGLSLMPDANTLELSAQDIADIAAYLMRE